MNKLFYLILLFSSAIQAQQSLSGKVFTVGTKQPVVSASVYLSNTSVGTVVNEKGEFRIDKFPTGKYDLIVSCLGYETNVQTVQSGQLPSSLLIELKPKIKELKEVVVESYDKDGWRRWGNFFIENFIGKSTYASDCSIKNTGAIKIKYSEKKATLKAFADEALIITNKDLGYELRYQMENFSYNFRSHLLFYVGYPFFNEMKAKRKSQQKHWDKNREEVYYGSMMHFMRSLYRNKLQENGFEVRRLIKKEKADYLINKILPGDSIAFGIDSITAGLEFTDCLDITYKGKKDAGKYFPKTTANGSGQSVNSQVRLLNDKYIQVFSNGNYYNPISILSMGFWASSEKIATMLPFDYKPLIKQ